MSANYLVVGGTKGIGRAAVTHLVASCSANVVFCGRDAAAGTALCESLANHAGRTVRFVAADIREEGDVTELFRVVERTLTSLDGAFNVSEWQGGTASSVASASTSQTRGTSTVATNVKGIWRCLRHELAIMSRQGRGSIVNCASVAGLRAADSLSASYTASKHALVGMTRALAVEYAGDGIRLNAVCPGVIDTEMLSGMAEELRVDLLKKNPAARLGNAHEVAAAAAFLLSDQASYISGATLTIDAGGLTGAL